MNQVISLFEEIFRTNDPLSYTRAAPASLACQQSLHIDQKQDKVKNNLLEEADFELRQPGIAISSIRPGDVRDWRMNERTTRVTSICSSRFNNEANCFMGNSKSTTSLLARMIT